MMIDSGELLQPGSRVLVICYMGRNRSKHVAKYLAGNGYQTDCAGLLPEGKNLVTQERVDVSEVLVFVLPRIREKFLVKYHVRDQRVITLDVEDRPEIACPDERFETEEALQDFYKTRVYPELERQMSVFLPSNLTKPPRG